LSRSQRQHRQGHTRGEEDNSENNRRTRERIGSPALREQPAQARAAAAHAEGAPFGPLQHDDEDERNRDQKVDDNEHCLHGRGRLSALSPSWADVD
jgi:hypothetical protein